MKKDARIYSAQILERIVRIEDFTRSGKEYIAPSKTFK